MTEQKVVAAPGPKKKRASSQLIINILLLTVILIILGLFVRSDQQKRAAEEQLQKTAQELEEAKKATQNTGAEKAAQVLESARKLIDIPTNPEPTIASITDVDALRKTNDFYKKAKNGDTLIITADRAILYDQERNLIIDVVPVQLDSQVAPSPSTTP
jgi:uncharacterized protein HemX